MWFFMRVNLRCRHDADQRRQATDLIDIGYGRDAIASLLDVPVSTVKQWVHTYKAIGLEGLLTMGSTHKRYDFETKLAAVSDFFDQGLTKQEIMIRYGIASKSPLDCWIRNFKDGGTDALKPKPKGRPVNTKANTAPKTHEQELEERVRRLEAENAYLKKVAALRAKKRLQVGSVPR